MKKNRKDREIKKNFMLISDAVLCLLLIAGDQISKEAAFRFLKRGSFVVIPDVLQLTYKENPGILFGFLNSQKLFILFFCFILLCLVSLILFRLPDKAIFVKAHIFISIFFSGALGNFVDRFRLGHVIDFVYFIGIDFPIFNLSDLLLTIGAIGLLACLIFCYSEKELEFLNFKKRYYREIK